MADPSFVHFKPEELKLARQWAAEGLKQADIARRLGRDKGTVSRQLAKPRGAVSVEGRPPAITEAAFGRLASALDRPILPSHRLLHSRVLGGNYRRFGSSSYRRFGSGSW